MPSCSRTSPWDVISPPNPLARDSFFFFPSIFPTLFLQSTPVESPDINFVSISAEEHDAEVTVTAPQGAGSCGATRHGGGTLVMAGSGCLRRGRLSPRSPRAGLGKGLPMHPCPCGAALGVDEAVGLSPTQDHLPGPRKPPRGQGCSPKGIRGQPPAWCWDAVGLLMLTVSCLCHRATMCWRTRTPLPRRKTVKGPGSLLSPSLSVRCHRWAAE